MRSGHIYKIFYGFINIRRGWEWSISLHPSPFQPHSTFSHIQNAMELIANGNLIVDNIYEIRKATECTKVMEEVAAQTLSKTGVMLDFRDFWKK